MAVKEFDESFQWNIAFVTILILIKQPGKYLHLFLVYLLPFHVIFTLIDSISFCFDFFANYLHQSVSFKNLKFFVLF